MRSLGGMGLEQDYVIRLIRRVVEAIARALKLSSGGNSEEAEKVLKDASISALGMELEILTMMDARSALELLGTRERALVFAQLLEAQGEIANSPGAAHRKFLHALEVLDLLEQRSPNHSEVREFRDRVSKRLASS